MRLIYGRFLGKILLIHHIQRTFGEWLNNEITLDPQFYQKIFFINEAHFWLNDYVNKQYRRIWSEEHDNEEDG